MKLVIFTSNGIRHKFVANKLAQNVDDTLVVCESKPNDATEKDQLTHIEDHFSLRHLTEKKMFTGNDFFNEKILPLLYKEVNSKYVFDRVKEFNPDLMIVFGSSIIKEPLLSLKPNKFINLHLGLSPYYRGSGTNFWPFVNKELEYVGSTILHLDPGIDTGDIVAHVKPTFEIDDDVHTIGCKVIEKSVEALIQIIKIVNTGKNIPRTKQWQVQNSKVFKNSDFTEEILKKYKQNLQNGIVKNFMTSSKPNLKLVPLKQ
tara:strand:- start:37 stop:813 length:777 start_codon:yes stop_codon:yes gene_type:complete